MKILLIIIICTFFNPIFSKSKPVSGFTVYLLGVPDKDKAFTNQIPHGESAIYTIVESINDYVFCGTRIVSGKTPWIICYNSKKQAVENKNMWPLDKFIKGEKCITCLVCASNDLIFGATSNLVDIDYKYAEDIKALNYTGGHLFYFAPSIQDFQIIDLGVPFTGEGIVTLVSDKKKGLIYGITAPSQVFFSLNVKTKKVTRIGKLNNIEIWRNLYIGKSTKALVIDNNGNVFGSAPQGKIFKYTLRTKKLSLLKAMLPTEVEGHNYDCISAFTRTKNNRFFGGTFLDGKLFEFFPKTGEIKSLGITSRTGNIRGLSEKDGILYGFSGSEKAGSRFFAYNIKTGEFKCFPDFKVYFHNDKNKFKWVPMHLKNIILVKNGIFVIGEDDSSGHIFTYKPQKMNWVK